jgi:hypothetical protein
VADLTERDAAIIERDRLVQFSQFGTLAVVKLYDKQGSFLREIPRKWNRYRKTTRDGAVWFLFRITDSKSEFGADLAKVGDGGFLEVMGARYRATEVRGWEPGESRIWNVNTNKLDKPSVEFHRQP